MLPASTSALWRLIRSEFAVRKPLPVKCQEENFVLQLVVEADRFVTVFGKVVLSQTLDFFHRIGLATAPLAPCVPCRARTAVKSKDNRLRQCRKKIPGICLVCLWSEGRVMLSKF